MITEFSLSVILVKFARNEFFGNEAGERSVVKISVVGTVTIATDFFILPLTYEQYNEQFMSTLTDPVTVAEIVGDINLPPGANGMKSEMFCLTTA